MLIYDHDTREFRFEGGSITESARLFIEEINRQIPDFCKRKEEEKKR